MAKIRGNHTSPGVYTQFNDLSYAAKSLGITKLGLVGETLMGPAFEPVLVSDWNEFETVFGGTSAKKFKDSQYPKYELPYIAKSYLQASDQLYVCRVLGLSGYKAGPAFVITASNSESTGADAKKYVIAVLRSRGTYDKYGSTAEYCSGKQIDYDSIKFVCKSVKLEGYTTPGRSTKCDGHESAVTNDEIIVTPTNMGQFTIVCRDGEKEIGRYSVSLNPSSKDYIYNVLGSTPTEGNAAVFVEELYDMSLLELANSAKVNQIDKEVVTYKDLIISAVANPVADFVTIPVNELSRKNLGQTYLCDVAGTVGESAVTDGFVYYDENGTEQCMAVGQVYVVKKNTFTSKEEQGTKAPNYVYMQLKAEGNPVEVGQIITENDPMTVNAVKVLTQNSFYCKSNDGAIVPVTDMSNYLEGFREAVTPWIVSEIKGDAKNPEVKKLFRIHTISDGSTANSMVKISITDIRPDEGLFNLFVRDFYDTDSSPVILESFRNITMEPGNSNYIGLKIGTLDGAYEQVSKYIIAEIIDNDMTRTCVPCGFLGYPTRDFKQTNNGVDDSIVNPTFTFNTSYESDIKDRKQYFGLSDITGVDVDMLYYKGKSAYNGTYTKGYTNSFHLDSSLNPEIMATTGATVTVDGIKSTSAITWTTVSPTYDNIVYTGAPIISSEAEMEGTLFENRNLRKFTVYPYGGFDGWDIYRGARTNTDAYKYNKYKGLIVNGYGNPFQKVSNADVLSLDAKSITSDYYAYLAGAKQFEIPEKYPINLFATPGIDYVNNGLLVGEILDIIEEKRGDSLYVITTPDKPFGASDDREDMYTSDEASSNLEDSAIDTYYATTYYPWVKYFDVDNATYINLPATKDALRNMADVDNKRYPWFAPAGMERGNVVCKKMHFFAKIDDEDTLYNGRINPLKTFSEDGVKIWGNKTLYTGNTPMNRVNVVRLMLYMRSLISKAGRTLLFDPNDATMKDDFEAIINPILAQIKSDRGITDYKTVTKQTQEQMDEHELSCTIWVKPTPTLEYIEISFNITPQGVEFED